MLPAEAYLVQISDPGEALLELEVLKIIGTSQGVLLGRQENCDVPLRNCSTVSSKQCCIRRNGAKQTYEINDKSANGTFVNGTRASKTRWTKLAESDTIRFSKRWISWRFQLTAPPGLDPSTLVGCRGKVPATSSRMPPCTPDPTEAAADPKRPLCALRGLSVGAHAQDTAPEPDTCDHDCSKSARPGDLSHPLFPPPAVPSFGNAQPATQGNGAAPEEVPPAAGTASEEPAPKAEAESPMTLKLGAMEPAPPTLPALGSADAADLRRVADKPVVKVQQPLSARPTAKAMPIARRFDLEVNVHEELALLSASPVRPRQLFEPTPKMESPTERNAAAVEQSNEVLLDAKLAGARAEHSKQRMQPSRSASGVLDEAERSRLLSERSSLRSQLLEAESRVADAQRDLQIATSAQQHVGEEREALLQEQSAVRSRQAVAAGHKDALCKQTEELSAMEAALQRELERTRTFEQVLAHMRSRTADAHTAAAKAREQLQEMDRKIQVLRAAGVEVKEFLRSHAQRLEIDVDASGDPEPMLGLRPPAMAQVPVAAKESTSKPNVRRNLDRAFAGATVHEPRKRGGWPRARSVDPAGPHESPRIAATVAEPHRKRRGRPRARSVDPADGLFELLAAKHRRVGLGENIGMSQACSVDLIEDVCTQD